MLNPRKSQVGEPNPILLRVAQKWDDLADLNERDPEGLREFYEREPEGATPFGAYVAATAARLRAQAASARRRAADA
jgi:hypothetical protein